MCFIDSNEKNPSYHDDGRIGGGYQIPSYSTTEALLYLSETIYFIGCCLQDLKHTLLERCHMYIFAMKQLFFENPS